MVYACCMYGCKNRRVKGSVLSFLKFPSNRELRAKWVHSTYRQGFKPTDSSRVCSAHFTEEDFKTTPTVKDKQVRQRLRLVPDAVPSIMNVPSRLHKVKKTRRSPKKRAPLLTDRCDAAKDVPMNDEQAEHDE